MNLRNILILTALVSLTACGVVPRSEEEQAADLAKVQACNAEGGYENTSPNGKFRRCVHNWSKEEQQLSYQMAVACLNGGGVPQYEYRWFDERDGMDKRNFKLYNSCGTPQPNNPIDLGAITANATKHMTNTPPLVLQPAPLPQTSTKYVQCKAFNSNQITTHQGYCPAGTMVVN